MKLLTHFAVFLIKMYQLVLSPWMGGRCRYLPSCSEYATEAIQVHGFFYGGWLSVKRILRCHPFGSSGLDLVPPKTSTRGKHEQ